MFNIHLIILSCMSANPELGLAAMYRFIKKSGADRVGDDAAGELREILEDIATRIASQALDLSLHAGRKTIKAEDIRLAAKNILKM
jgi:histone H3/H4